MKPRITVITLGVDDLERALVFYRDGLGFPTKGSLAKNLNMERLPFLICRQA
jgi:uncharacterized protein